MKTSGAADAGTVGQAVVKQPPPAPEKCPGARLGLRFYHAKVHHWYARMLKAQSHGEHVKPRSCGYARTLADRWRERAASARRAYEAWHSYHHEWWKWLPDKWQRVGACETGYGKRPGRWDWNSGAYQGAFGFAVSSWDAFAPRADVRAGPYPSEAYLATPRQQYEVALAIWRAYGFSGWGCRNA